MQIDATGGNINVVDVNATAVIKHIVMWNISGSDEGEKIRNINIVKERFESLADIIPGLLFLEIGIDTSGIDYACDVVLYSEFASQEDLENYASHPAHLAVRDQLVGLRIARHQVDYLSRKGSD